MLKKTLLTAILITMSLNANSLNYLDCENEFEICALECAKSTSAEMCIEKCEMLYDKCNLEKETDSEINLLPEETPINKIED